MPAAPKSRRTAAAKSRPTAEFQVETPHGTASVALDRPVGGVAVRALVVLGHGASGGVDAVDLLAVRDAALAAGHAVARVTQPYRVQGRRAPAPAQQLDAAWVSVIAAIPRRIGKAVPLIVGGRSSGARVAARTAAQVQATGVLALAFPLHPPGKPGSSRAGELDPARPTLVINGEVDPFGVPDPVGAVEVVRRPGARHDLRRDPAGTAQIAMEWIDGLLAHG